MWFLSGNDKKDRGLLPDLVGQINRPISQAFGGGTYDSFGNHSMLRRCGIKATILPREDAKIKQHGNTNRITLSRDDVVREIRKLGHNKWKQQSGYHRRSLAETTIFRFAKILSNDSYAFYLKIKLLKQ